MFYLKNNLQNKLETSTDQSNYSLSLAIKLLCLNIYSLIADVMVLNEIIEQAGRQSRASEQNGTYLIYKYVYCIRVSMLFNKATYALGP